MTDAMVTPTPAAKPVMPIRSGTHTFHAVRREDWEQVSELLRAHVLKFFAKRGKLSAQEAEKMRQWRHRGFCIHAGRRKRAENGRRASAADAPLPSYRSYAGFVRVHEAETHELHAQIFDQGRPVKPHPDDFMPPAKDGSDAIEIIELPRNAIPSIPRKNWSELILKVWEVGPLICPVCGRLIRVAGLLENSEKASALLVTLGMHAYATDCQGAQTPPPASDREEPKLPFASFLEGIV